MQREDVDGAALTARGKRRLHDGLPAERLETSHRDLDQVRVGGVQQTIEGFASPSNEHLERGAESLGHQAQRTDLDVIETTGLDLRDELPRDADLTGEVELAPAPANAQRSNALADAYRFHAASMASSAYPRLTEPGVGPAGFGVRAADSA